MLHIKLCLFIVLPVMTYCEVHSVAAVLYVCYVRTSCLDSLLLTAFQSLHKSSSLADVIAVSNHEVSVFCSQLLLDTVRSSVIAG